MKFLILSLFLSIPSFSQLNVAETHSFYTKRFHQVGSGFCEDKVVLTYDIAQKLGPFVKLYNTIEGQCERMVFPNSRVYFLAPNTEFSCGSIVYTAKLDFKTVQVWDNRRRMCRDLRSTFEIYEYDNQGKLTNTYFSGIKGENFQR